MATILCIGDSNTHGTMPMASLGGSGRFGHDARWPSVMAKALGPGFEVINEGQPGRTTVHDDPFAGPYRNGVTVLPALLESHKPLDMVIVKLGTNDLKYCYHVGPADIALSLERMVRLILGFEAGVEGRLDIIVVAPPPILEAGCLADMFAGGAAKSKGLARAIKAMTDRMGIGFVDAGAVIEVSPLDGIHYEMQAQVALGLAMAKAVNDQFGQ
ncbi:MAG: SGNH/GDSL hydrolase family protein [Alphaproteobacteria bacterium]